MSSDSTAVGPTGETGGVRSGEEGTAGTVDARGLRCPMPLVKAKLAMEALSPGDGLLVMATDPEAAIDLAAWAVDEGHALRERAAGGWTEFLLHKGSSR